MADDGLRLRRRSGWWVAPARATDFTIAGSPLTVYANDAGQLQVAFNGSTTGEFFPSGLAPANAGVNIAVAQVQQTPPLTVYGFDRGQGV